MVDDGVRRARRAQRLSASARPRRQSLRLSAIARCQPRSSADLDLALVPFLSDILIVRSSAVGEDSGNASFAGQLDSIAGVSGARLVRRALLDVWASRWSARSLTYQLARGASLDGMGVIVQRQVASVLSGVLFTVAPDHDGEMLVEYCGGSGEALVSGRVNPGRVSNRSRQPALVDASDARRRARPQALDLLICCLTLPSRSSHAGRSTSSAPSVVRRTSSGRWTSTVGCGSCSRGRSRSPVLDAPHAGEHIGTIAGSADVLPGCRLSDRRERESLLVERQRQRELSAADHAAALLDRPNGLLPLLPQPRASRSACRAAASPRWSSRSGTSSASTARGCTTT